MAKVTSKLQVSIPKAIAEEFGIRPGAEIEWIAAGETIRVVPAGRRSTNGDEKLRLGLFDEATHRQRARQGSRRTRRAAGSRGWRRDDLYTRGRTD